MSGEEWRPVVGFEGYYEVSNEGRVRSLHWAEPRIMADRAHPRTGHLHVDLRGAGKKKAAYVHQLVARAFIGEPTGPLVRHLDDVSTNNHVSNLAYGTLADNAQDALRNGRNHFANLTECHKGHPFTPENTRTRAKQGGRDCIQCNKEAVRRYQQRKFGRPLEPKQRKNVA